jgi:hypothetical protein
VSACVQPYCVLMNVSETMLEHIEKSCIEYILQMALTYSELSHTCKAFSSIL